MRRFRSRPRRRGPPRLAGCNGGHTEFPTISDHRAVQGAHVLLSRSGTCRVDGDARRSADRVADIKTRAGRFVRSIDGIDGSSIGGARLVLLQIPSTVARGETSAANTICDGDVEWWDFRSWAGRCTCRWWSGVSGTISPASAARPRCVTQCSPSHTLRRAVAGEGGEVGSRTGDLRAVPSTR